VQLWESSPNIVLPENTWTHVSVALQAVRAMAGGYHSGPHATQADFQDVLANLQGLYIRGEYKWGSETAALDNVQLNSTTVPEPSTLLVWSGLGAMGRDGVAEKEAGSVAQHRIGNQQRVIFRGDPFSFRAEEHQGVRTYESRGEDGCP